MTTQVNLLPPQIREKQKVRRLTGAVVAGGVVAVVLLLVVFTLQTGRLGTIQTQLEQQQAVNAGLQGRIVKLQKFATLQKEVSARRMLVGNLLKNQVLWSEVLEHLSEVIPDQVYLTSFSASLTQSSTDSTAVGTATGTGSPVYATVQFGGAATSHPEVADWLQRLERVKGWVNAWVQSLTKSVSTDTNGAPTHTEVAFTGSVDLTQAATVNGRPA
jgi:Tfp pilus assembly protein PilN